MATNIRFSDATWMFAQSSCWPLRPEHVHPILSKLSFRYHDVPWLESVIEKVQRCQDDQALRESQRIAPIRPLLGRLDELQAYLEALRIERQSDWEAAERIVAFEKKLMQATGGTLRALYQELPEELQGAVELGYDSHNNPSVRLYETLLYHDSRYNAPHHNFRFFTRTADIEYLPARLPNPEAEIALRIPFDDARMDRVFSLDLAPLPRGEVMDLLGLTSNTDPRLARLFTDQPIRKPEPWTGASPRIRYLGHAGVLLEWRGISILVDPLVPSGSTGDRYSFSDLPARIDYVLITHGHDDHFELSTLLRLRHRIGCLYVPRNTGLLWDYSLKAMARRLGFKHVVEFDAYESVTPGPDMEITAIPFHGEHGELFAAKTAWLVRFGTEQMLFTADSNTFESRTYEDVRKITGDIQTVFVGTACTGQSVETYNPLLFGWFERGPDTAALEQKFATRETDAADADGAWSIVTSVGGKRVYVYALGSEPWVLGYLGPYKEIFHTEARKVVERARQAGFLDAKVLVGACELRLT